MHELIPFPARAFRPAAFLLLLLSAACAPRSGVEQPRPAVHLGDAEIRDLAALLRLEDRREYDVGILQAAAAAAHPEVRRRTALALGRLRDVQGMPMLTRLLQDTDTAVAATAAFSLGQLGDTAAVHHLTSYLAPEPLRRTPTVAAEAAAALGKLRSAEAAATLQEFLRTTPLAAGRDPAVEHALLAIWRHPREPDAAPILRWTEAPDAELRWRAAYALVRRPDPAATPRLLQLAADRDARVRSLAVRGLTAPLADTAGLPADTVLPVVLAATEDPDYATVVNAIRTLGTYASADAVHRLQVLLETEPARAVAAAEALGRLGSSAADAAPALRRVADDAARPVGVRAAALQALVTVAPMESAAAAQRLVQDPTWRMRAAAGRALAALDPSPQPSLVALIRDRDPRVGSITLRAVVEAAGDTVAPLRPLLLEALGADDVQMRTAALTGLARLRDPTTLPVILDAVGRALQDEENDAALAALDALGALHEAGVPVANALVRRFSRPDDYPDDYLVRQRAVNLLGDPIRAAWGEPLPLDPGRSPADYVALVRQWVVPALANQPLPRAHITTDAGVIELRLFASDAPLTVESFLRLAERGYFDGQEWPRVVPNFVIQGGDPRGDQTGGPGYAIRDEFNRHRYQRGTLGMALSGPDTGGSQFFITHSPQPHLDGGYTVFGEVVTGMEVVDRVVAGERIHSIRRVP
jgi:cyclophilin family peptidyl-prolyl cis-trans isomerase/HEAT repeat protein